MLGQHTSAVSYNDWKMNFLIVASWNSERGISQDVWYAVYSKINWYAQIPTAVKPYYLYNCKLYHCIFCMSGRLSFSSHFVMILSLISVGVICSI